MTSNNSDNNNIDYMNSRPLDVHTWSDYSEVNDFVDDIYQLLKSIKGHKKGNKRLLKVLLLDLYVAWCADHELKIMCLAEIIMPTKPSPDTMNCISVKRSETL